MLQLIYDLFLDYEPLRKAMNWCETNGLAWKETCILLWRRKTQKVKTKKTVLSKLYNNLTFQDRHLVTMCRINPLLKYIMPNTSHSPLLAVWLWYIWWNLLHSWLCRCWRLSCGISPQPLVCHHFPHCILRLMQKLGVRKLTCKVH